MVQRHRNPPTSRDAKADERHHEGFRPRVISSFFGVLSRWAGVLSERKVFVFSVTLYALEIIALAMVAYAFVTYDGVFFDKVVETLPKAKAKP